MKLQVTAQYHSQLFELFYYFQAGFLVDCQFGHKIKIMSSVEEHYLRFVSIDEHIICHAVVHEHIQLILQLELPLR